LAYDHTEDPAVFNPEDLSSYVAVVFLLTGGDVLNESQQSALEAFVADGGGWAGIHSAADTEFDWPFYGELVGAQFRDHPAIQKASIDIIEFNHPSTRHLPRDWEPTDEWYNFRSDPTKKVNVLLSVDESTYSGGKMGDPHPIAWCHTRLGGHAWYTGMGHTEAIWKDAFFQGHVLGGINWSAKLGPGDCELDGGPSL
jgi:type 1 glutamine amidotransferase